MLFNAIYFILGSLFMMLLYKILYIIYNKKKIKENNEYFSNILESIILNGKFISYFGEYVHISINLLGEDLSVYCKMESRAVLIFKGDVCIRIDISDDKKISYEILDKVISRWSSQISPTSPIRGQIRLLDPGQLSSIRDSEIDGILNRLNNLGKTRETKKNDLYVDDILDKINEFGIDNLSDEEISFLKKYK